jgi:putative peptidoglycan lipid II flippase
VLFTSHYLMLRGFYALERTRTVFWVQCGIAVTNIALAVLLTRAVDPGDVAAALVVAYAGAYLVGSLASYLLLRHVLGGLETPRLVRFLVRLALAAGVATAVGWAVRAGLEAAWPSEDKLHALVLVAAITLSGAGAYLGVSRLLHIDEVTGVSRLVTGRLRR